jgi:hypothetical protein
VASQIGRKYRRSRREGKFGAGPVEIHLGPRWFWIESDPKGMNVIVSKELGGLPAPRPALLSPAATLRLPRSPRCSATKAGLATANRAISDQFSHSSHHLRPFRQPPGAANSA